MSAFTIQSQEDLDFIYELALKLRENTPYSFRILANNLNIFVPYSDNLKELYNFYQPDTLMSLPIFPSEVIYITYNYTVECPDENCVNFKKSLEKLSIVIDAEISVEKQISQSKYRIFYVYNKRL